MRKPTIVFRPSSRPETIAAVPFGRAPARTVTPSHSAAPPVTKPQPVEKRRARRRTCRSAAIVISPSLHQALNCVVCDSSSTGALLEFGRHRGGMSWESEDLPPRFVLNLTQEHLSYDCRLVWRNAKMAGVQFMGPARPISKAVAPRPAPTPKSTSMLSRFMK